MPEIILQHVTKRFDKFVAVQDLDLQIQDRGFITLLGPSAVRLRPTEAVR